MSKTIYHKRDAVNNVHLLQRKYLGKGRFYQRGIFQGMEIGDVFLSFTVTVELVVDKIISISDSKSDQLTEEQKKDAYIECELYYPNFVNEEQFLPIRPNNFGN